MESGYDTGTNSQGLSSRAQDYRAFVGPAEKYDLLSASQFNLMTFLGLRESHFLLDIGCGSLRAGKLFIPYLLPGHYFGIEPEQWLIEEGIEHEIGRDTVRIKKPTFSNDDNFTLSTFGQTFDFIIAQSIFSHASQPQIRRCLSETRQVLRPQGLFAATFMQGDEDYRGDAWVYPGCVTYTLERLRQLAEEQELLCQPLAWPHPNKQRWVVFTHAASSPYIPTPEHDIGRIAMLEAQLDSYKKRLQDFEVQFARLRQHPYIRFGLALRRMIQSLIPRRQNQSGPDEVIR